MKKLFVLSMFLMVFGKVNTVLLVAISESNMTARENAVFGFLDSFNLSPATDISVPVRSDSKKSPRMQFPDTGLLNHNLNIQADLLNINDLGNAFKGAIIPHIITREIISIQHQTYKKPNFWVRDKTQSSAEVDLLITSGDKVYPVEIKSGPTGKLRSLHQFIELSSHPYAVRIYANSFRIEQHKTPGGKEFLLMKLPYYLRARLREYIDFFTTEYRLNNS